MRWRERLEEASSRSSSSRSANAAVFAMLTIDSLTTGLFIPLSLLYLVARSGASLTHIGVLLSLAGALALPLPLWIGRLVDRVGAWPVVLAAQLLQAAGFGAYLVASNLPAVFVAATVASLGRGALWSSVYVLLSALTDHATGPRARERWFALVGSLRAVGYGTGALIAGLTLAADSVAIYQAVIAVNIALLLVAGGLIVTFVPRIVASASPALDERRGYRILWTDRPYLALIGLNTIFALCNVLLSIGLPPFVARGLPAITWAVGPLLAMNTLVQAFCQPLMVRLVRPLSRAISLCLAGLLWACWSLATIGALYLPNALRVSGLALAVLCYAAAQMIHSPVSNAISADAAPADLRGRYLAIFQSSFAIATVVAPTMFAVLLDIGNAIPWIALTTVVALTIPGMLPLAPHLPAAAVTGVRSGRAAIPG